MAGVQGSRNRGLSGAEPAIARDGCGVVADYSRTHDSAVACFMDDFEACIAHCHSRDAPAGHFPPPYLSGCLSRSAGVLRSSRTHSVSGCLEADVRRTHPRRRTMEIDQGHRVRASSALGGQEKARPRIRGPNGSLSKVFKGCSPHQNIQQFSDLTRHASRGAGRSDSPAAARPATVVADEGRQGDTGIVPVRVAVQTPHRHSQAVTHFGGSRSVLASQPANTP